MAQYVEIQEDEVVWTAKKDENGLPICHEECPSHDGKRCGILGFRPHYHCEPCLIREFKKWTNSNE